jgi:hypothetical protein
MTEQRISLAEVEDLASRLDASGDLSDRDREVLVNVFALAGSAVAEAQSDDEVAGFAFEFRPFFDENGGGSNGGGGGTTGGGGGTSGPGSNAIPTVQSSFSFGLGLKL